MSLPANPTLTYGDGHLDDFVNLWDFDLQSETTSTGLVTTTIDTVRAEADDYWNYRCIKYLSGANAGQHRIITDFDQGTNTFTHEAFANVTTEGDKYVLSKSDGLGAGGAAFGDFEMSLDPEDILKVKLICDGAGAAEEYVYFNFPLPTNLDTDTYTQLVTRHKASDSNIKCKIVLVFTVGTQTIDLGNAEKWTATTTAITAAKTLTDIRILAQHDAALADGTYYSYYDFVKICKGTFTFPHVGVGGRSGGIFPEFTKDIQKTKIAGRDLAEKADMGIDDITIKLTGDILYTEDWGTHFFGDHILDILRNDAWSWFTSDRGNFKVMITRFAPSQDVASGSVTLWELDLQAYSASPLNDTTWYPLDWMGK